MSLRLTSMLLGIITTVLGLISLLLSPKSFFYRSADPGECKYLTWPLPLQTIQPFYLQSDLATLPGECYFSSDYVDSSQRFLSLADKLNLEVQFMNISLELSTQVAIYRGKSHKYLVHISGIHGVESYAGDAVQLSSLQYLQNLLQTSENVDSLPTIVFIHIANPYGFHNHRRVNEDNVDLNRNFLTIDEWNMAKTRDPNYASYVDFDSFLNPQSKPTRIPLIDEFFTLYDMASVFSRHPIHTVKKSMVAGNYHKADGYGFGGFEHAASTRNIIDLLTKQLRLPVLAKELVLIDVHTGLGPYGVDTLMYDSTSDIVQDIFPTELSADRNKVIGGLITNAFGGNAKASKGNGKKDAIAEAVSAGYELTIGTVSEGLCKNFAAPFLSDEHRVCITEEFGTVPTILVGKNALNENYAHFWGSSSEKTYYHDQFLPCFYINSKDWKRNVARRGTLVFKQALEYLVKK